MNEKKYKINFEQGFPIINILGEICYGFQIDQFEQKIGEKKEVVEMFLERILRDEKKGMIETYISESEIELITKAFKEVEKELEEWEFPIRIGVMPQEANMMKDKIQLLINVLLDSSSREDERGDAAIDLRYYPELRSLKPLIRAASNSNEDFVILDNCAQSIAEICIKMNFFDEKLFEKMAFFAKETTLQYIKAKKPELLIKRKNKRPFKILKTWIISLCTTKNSTCFCRVCGYDQGFEPWGKDNTTPTFDICDCCQVQFGYQDCTVEGIKEFREKWLIKGANWCCPKDKPENWSLAEQLKNIPPEFK